MTIPPHIRKLYQNSFTVSCLFLFSLLSGCTVYDYEIEQAAEVCKGHGGIKLLRLHDWYPRILCKDGFDVRLYDSGTR